MRPSISEYGTEAGRLASLSEAQTERTGQRVVVLVDATWLEMRVSQATAAHFEIWGSAPLRNQ